MNRRLATMRQKYHQFATGHNSMANGKQVNDRRQIPCHSSSVTPACCASVSNRDDGGVSCGINNGYLAGTVRCGLHVRAEGGGETFSSASNGQLVRRHTARAVRRVVSHEKRGYMVNI